MRASIWFAGLLGLMLTGCQQKPIVKTEIVYVNKEVFVPCASKMPEKPVFILDKVPDSRVERARGLLVDRLKQKAYIDQLEAALSGCILQDKGG